MGRRRGGGATLGERVVFNINLKLSLPLLPLCFFFFFSIPPPPLLSLCSLLELAPDGLPWRNASSPCAGKKRRTWTKLREVEAALYTY